MDSGLPRLTDLEEEGVAATNVRDGVRPRTAQRSSAPMESSRATCCPA
jgi:hypothetical protein